MKVDRTNKFVKDYKLMAKRGYPMHELDAAITILASGNQLPQKYKDHPLHGNIEGCRECHIRGDWLLVYEIDGTKLTLLLMRTGTHSDLFDKTRR